MNRLYNGHNEIKTAVIKTRVNSDFITAGPNDILTGKTSIDSDYNKITGTMEITDNISELTQDATAVASDITSGKTGYNNGNKITGTAARPTPSSVINGIISSYNVANNNVISAGDFVKFVEEICGCGYETTTIQNGAPIIRSVYSEDTSLLQLDINRILFLFKETNRLNTICGTIINVNNGSISYSDVQEFNVPESVFDIRLLTLGNSQIVVLYGNQASLVNVDENNTISIGTSVSVSNGTRRKFVVLDSNEVFITYEGWDGSDTTINYSRMKLDNGELVVNIDIPSDYTFYPASNQHTICKIAHNKLLLAYAQANFNRASNAVVLDISNPNFVYAGPVRTLSTIWTVSLDSIQLEEGIAMVSYYNGYSDDGIGGIVCYKVDGLTLSAVSKSFGYSGVDVVKTKLCKLTDTCVVLTFIGRYSMLSVLPIKRTKGSNEFENGTRYEYSSMSSYAIDVIKIENNKILFVYTDFENNTHQTRSSILQINNESTVSNMLTVYDMNKPLTKTMVALALNGDKVDGISDGYGIGALYGGDTINVITPSI